MDKLLFGFGILVAIAIIATGGFGLFKGTLSGNWLSLPRGLGISSPSGAHEPAASSPAPAGGRSPYEKHVRISSVRVVTSNPPTDEYVLISNSDSRGASPIAITGWQLAGVQSGNWALPEAAKIPLRDAEGTVWLGPGEMAYVHSGRSPIGVGFEENLCTGYFNQNRQFTPSLTEACPRPDTSALVNRYFNDACLQLLDSLPACRVPDLTNTGGIGGDCQNFIINTYSYGSCVDTYRTRSDFSRGTWHLYLNRQERLWRSLHDVITLTDDRGLIIDTYQY